MNASQRLQAAIPQGYHRNELAQRPDIDPARAAMTADIAEYLAAKSVKKPSRLVDPWGRPLS